MKKSPDNQLFFNFEIPEELPVPVPEPIAAEPEVVQAEDAGTAVAENPCEQIADAEMPTPAVLEVRSSNAEYHKVCKRIRSLEQSLYRGTPMELLAKANVADYMIAAVPENMISIREVPDSWGLWYIREDKSVYEVKEPVRQECTAASRQHLVQNIGHSALSSVLFAHGVKVRADGKVRFTRQPKARRK